MFRAQKQFLKPKTQRSPTKICVKKSHPGKDSMWPDQRNHVARIGKRRGFFGIWLRYRHWFDVHQFHPPEKNGEISNGPWDKKTSQLLPSSWKNQKHRSIVDCATFLSLLLLTIDVNTTQKPKGIHKTGVVFRRKIVVKFVRILWKAWKSLPHMSKSSKLDTISILNTQVFFWRVFLLPMVFGRSPSKSSLSVFWVRPKNSKKNRPKNLEKFSSLFL